MLNELKTIWSTRTSKTERDTSFEYVMKIAHEIAKKSPEGLRELIRALLLPLQAEHIVAVAERGPHSAPADIKHWEFFFRVENASDYYRKDKPVEVLSLGRDVLLPTAWERTRYVNALATIGTGKKQGAWLQDDGNHVISLLLPWRIGFVGGGNHSITAGILMSEGVITATDVYDMTPMLKQVRCDGKTYREIDTGRVLGKVQDPRRAAVFEIGRLMMARA